MQTIDITPKWRGIVPLLVLVLQNPKADPKAHNDAMAELLRLADYADSMNADINKGE